MRVSLSVLAVAVLVVGCGGPASNATASPSSHPTPSTGIPPEASPTASPVASPVALTGAYALLATSTAADTYTVSIVAIDGKVVGSAQASSPTSVTCGDAAAAVVPLPVSTSNDRAYYMDAQGVVRFLTVQGETGRATTVPTGGGRRSMFAVSPDDLRIAVVVSDYTASGVAIKLYVEDLNGAGNHLDIYTTSGAFGLWPIGWHGSSDLVLAYVPACSQGGGPLASTPRELHVVDPATAVRRVTIGGPACLIAGPSSPAGTVCEDTSFTHAYVVDWTAVTLTSVPVKGPTPAFLSPDGHIVALAAGATTTFAGASRTLNMVACGWIDSIHVISGGDVQQQPRIGNVSSGAVNPVATQGTCAGRLPGGL